MCEGHNSLCISELSHPSLTSSASVPETESRAYVYVTTDGFCPTLFLGLADGAQISCQSEAATLAGLSTAVESSLGSQCARSMHGVGGQKPSFVMFAIFQSCVKVTQVTLRNTELRKGMMGAACRIRRSPPNCQIVLTSQKGT